MQIDMSLIILIGSSSIIILLVPLLLMLFWYSNFRLNWINGTKSLIDYTPMRRRIVNDKGLSKKICLLAVLIAATIMIVVITSTITLIF